MDEIEIDLLELAKKLRQHLFSILRLDVIFEALSYAASVFVVTPKYEATTMIVSNSKDGNASKRITDILEGKEYNPWDQNID
ncbi:Wzz/FepE/Etk N-terminal domain-containing protein [Anaerococcus hydrogenalis]|uniref:Wzz/FepE/Etk N-terminal domain-containing protein n=1 Tax=Anaerococcus hydrogenalis TaxID=33029 RepID=UPI0023F38F41|nr:Wzz/FepE/Etk N-terminal domain-containing protein [Anaerococcus hydrogenalis]